MPWLEPAWVRVLGFSDVVILVGRLCLPPFAEEYVDFPLLVLKGIHSYRKYVFLSFSWGLNQMEV